MTWAHWFLMIVGAYVLAGIVFAGAFLWRGLFAVDPAARGSHPAFFALLVPGLVALWPVMWRIWARAPMADQRDGGGP